MYKRNFFTHLPAMGVEEENEKQNIDGSQKREFAQDAKHQNKFLDN